MSDPYLVLAAQPRELTRFRDLFTSGPGSVATLLEHPGEFRYAGWSLETRGSSRIVGGEFLEVQNGRRKQIRIFEDGTLLFRAAADETFLGWGSDHSEFQRYPRLNAIALVEVAASFVHFYCDLLPHMASQPSSIRLQFAFQGARVGKEHMYVTPGEINSPVWLSNDKTYRISDPDATGEFTIDSTMLRSDPDRAALELAAKIFLAFGVAPDTIPYTSSQSGVRRIDLEKIRKL